MSSKCGFGGYNWLYINQGLNQGLNQSLNQGRSYSGGILNGLMHVGTFGNVGTSETVRKMSVMGLNYTKTGYPAWLLEWFIGFAEGDSSFTMDSGAKRLYFVIRQKDPKVLFCIKSYLGFGSLTLAGDGYWNYTVSAQKHILILINIFNGNLVLEKRNNQFINWLNAYNLWFSLSNPINYLGKGTFMGLDNAWLCGFTDSDGSFGFKLTRDSKRKHGYRVRVYWYIEQSYAQADLEHMRNVLGFGYIEPKIITKTSFQPSIPGNAYRFQTQSVKDCVLLLDYFLLYKPIHPSRAIRFIRWKRVVNWCNNLTWSEHLPQIKSMVLLNKNLDLD